VNTRIEVPGEILAGRVREFAAIARPVMGGEWAELLDADWSQTFLGNIAEKRYWVDLYCRRQ
jgi:hypothetical protein